MKKYLLITVISTILISGLIYSIVYVPQVSDYLDEVITIGKNNRLLTEPEVQIYTLPTDMLSTLPDLSITAEDNFKNLKFGDLNLRIASEFKGTESAEKIILRIDNNNEIQGFYYNLVSEPRKDIDASSFESELLKNTYSLEKKSNIPDEFVKNVFNLIVGSEVEDTIGGVSYTYTVKDFITYQSPNLTGYFFDSDDETRYKVIILSTKKLYIFNIKVSSENLKKIEKTFYNVERVR